MTLTSILLFAAFAVLFRLLARPAWRGWLLFVASVLAVYWLQPSTPVRYLDFWFPTLTLALAVLGWVLTRPPAGPLARDANTATAVGPSSLRANLPAAGVLVGMVLLVGLTRYLDGSGLIFPSRPPAFEQVLAAVAVTALLALGAALPRWRGAQAVAKAPAGALWLVIAVLVALLVALKTPALAAEVSVGLRNLMNQSTALAAAGDLRWLGFSYVAFRLIHTLRERQNRRLPAVTLQEYLVYVIFFPAFTAGPIDRIDRFVKDLRKLTAEHAEVAEKSKINSASSVASASSASFAQHPVRAAVRLSFIAQLVLPQAWPEWASAAQRLTLGLLKKFVIADGLALVALNGANAVQVNQAGWAWALLYAYSLQIYFDFSGYTDIAIGLGRLLGINLPENFNAPYLKPNLTLFWNSWHMTLTNWFRAYYFNPVTRWLRTLKLPSIPRPLPPDSGRKGSHSSPFFAPRAGQKTALESSPALEGGGRGVGERGLSAIESAEEKGIRLPPGLIIFFTQLSTFVLIGLWHGVTWNFVLWGAWHGLGLYAQNRWSEAMRPRYAALDAQGGALGKGAWTVRLQKGLSVVSTLLTFHYVALGWVFFALPDPGLSLRVLGKLFGIGA